MPTQSRALSAVFVSLLALAMAFAGLMAVGVPAAANHDTVVWSQFWQTTFNVNEDDLFPTAFADGNGYFYLFYYVDDLATGDRNIWVTKYRTTGANGLPEWVLTSQVNLILPDVAAMFNFYGQYWAPSVTRDHDGNLYVAWSDDGNNIYVSKSTDGAATWGDPVRVDPISSGSFDSGPVITATPAGTLYVAWLQLWFPGGYQNLTVAQSADRGATWTGKTNVTALGSAIYLDHSIASDSQGRAYLTYTSYLGGLEGQVNFTWSDNGAAWSAPVGLNGGTLGVFPAVAVDSMDRVHVSWVDYRLSPSGYTTYWYRRSDDRGATWSLEMPASQGVYPTSFFRPSIQAHGDTIVLVWTAFAMGVTSFAYSVSADGGDLWYPEAFARIEGGAEVPSVTADENGTFYVGASRFDPFDGEYELGFVIWDSPPAAPTITGILRGAGSLTVSWSTSPDGDSMGYRVWRSVDGVSYELAATVDSSTTSYADTGLANGTYWYRVTAFDRRGTSSHASEPMSATVGLTTEEMIDLLEAQIAATQATIAQLQADLAAAQTDIDDLQGRLTQLQTDLASLQNDLDSLQSDVDANDAATQQRLNDLENQIDSLQNQLNQMRSEVATQTMSYVNMLLVILVLALVAYLLVQQMRMRKMPPSRPEANPPPQQSMQPPPQAPRPPEDDL